jgi:hypothetical protein
VNSQGELGFAVVLLMLVPESRGMKGLARAESRWCHEGNDSTGNCARENGRDPLAPWGCCILHCTTRSTLLHGISFVQACHTGPLDNPRKELSVSVCCKELRWYIGATVADFVLLHPFAQSLVLVGKLNAQEHPSVSC